MTFEERERQKPIKDLACNCCGGSARNRQWHNRDTGYGMCDDCIAWVRSRKMPESEIRDCYGIDGIHFGIKELEKIK